MLCLVEANTKYFNREVSNLISNIYEKNIENIHTEKYSLGMSGIAGILYSLIRLYNTTKEEKYLDQIKKQLKYYDFNSLIINSSNNGIVNGRAGLLISFLEIYNKGIETEFIIPLIILLYENLKNTKLICKNGIFWNAEFQRSPLCGMAHGSSGIILSLLRYYLIFDKNAECKDLIKNAVLYENTYYNSYHNNWRDNRDFIKNEDDAFQSFGWSHGSPGIGLVRLSILESKIFEDDEFYKIIYRDLINCVKSTSNNGFMGMDNIIFGNYGNAELLFRFARYSKNNKILDNIEKELNDINVLYLIENNKGLLSSGLFNGVSGCIYQLLYFNHDISNSILTFECN